MTNKKLKMAAMSVALTACVAASPLAANADAPEAAPEKKEPAAEEIKKEENTAEPQVNNQDEKAQETLKDAEVKYNKDNPTTNPDGSQKLDGVIVTNPEGSGETDPKPNPNPNPNPNPGETNPNPEGGETNPNPEGGETNPNPEGGETNPNPEGGETNPNPDSGKTDPDPNPNPGSGETDPDPNPNPNPGSGDPDPNPNPNPNPEGGETNPNPNPNPDSGETKPNPNPGSGETDTKEKKPEKVEIGTAEKTEKSETNVETKPNPGAEPIVDTTTPPTVEKNPDGSTTITQPTVTPGTETTTTTGTGEAKGDLHEKEEEVPKKDIDLKKELGEKPDISWQIKKDDEAVNGYKVEEVTNSEDGNRQTLKLKKEEETTAEMTAEDIAKLVDAEKPTVNPDGTYTLTRTETILDAEGNPQTRTTYITIQDNKVITKTTTELTITRQKEKQEGNERVDFEVKYPEITVTNKEKPEEKQTITRDLLDTILSQNPKEDGSYEYTDGEGRKYEVKVDGTAEKLNNAEIVERLNRDNHTEYTLGADGEIYYKTEHGETVKLDVTQNQLLRRSLTYKVTLTTTEKGSVENESKKPEEESKAKMNAIRKALNNAVGEMGVEDPVKARLTSAIANATLDPNGGTFTAEIDGKIYTLTYTGAEVKVETKDAANPDVSGKAPENITDVKDNTVTGTAYVTGSTITYQDGAEYKTTGAGTLGIGADFKAAPAGATEVETDESGRITSYKDAQGNTHSFEYTSVDLNALTPEERAKLEAAAKKDGWNTENLTASLTQVKWKVESPRTETQQTTPIENGTPVDLSKKEWSSQNGNNGTVDFTHGGTTHAGMTLESTAADGTKTYKKTDDKGTVTIITVTTRQLTEEEIKAQFDVKFGADQYTMDAANHTVTYKGEDGKTYKASYVDREEKLTVEVQKPQEVAATGSTEAEAKAAFLKQLEEARQKAENAGETLVIEYKENGEIKYLTVTEKTTWEEISKVVGKVVNYNAMTDAELVEYLKKLETTAKKDGKYYDGSTKGDTPYYRDADGKMQRVPQGVNVQTGWKTDWLGIPHKYSYVKIDGKEHEVRYGNNDIDHLDLATDSKLTLSEKEKDGTAKTDDCVLLNPKLTWSENAGQLVAGKGEQAKLSNRITYDNEGDNDPNTGHHEYPRASWDNPFAKDNAPTKSVFYKVEGQVAYGKLGNDYISEKRARADLQAYKDAHPDLDLSKAQVVKVYKNQTSYSSYYYQIYLYQSDLAAYGYMSDDNNTCGNALFNADGQRYYVGGYDLTLGNLTQTDKNHVVAMGKNTTALSATFKRRKLETLTNRELRYTPNSVTETIIHESEVTGQGTDLSGSYRADYTKTADYTDEQQKGIEGTGTGSYKSFTNLIRNIFTGEDTGTVEGGFIKYVYHTEKTKDGDPVKFEADQMIVTTKQDAEVHYTFTSQESRDVWIKGYTQTVVPPVNPGPDTPELPPVEDAKPAPAPAPAPEAPVLPVVQDARPDPAPAPAPAPAPETPVLPAVQDAKLIQTGTSGWLADLMLGAGMVLSAAGYWMERKRKAMFYKSQH